MIVAYIDGGARGNPGPAGYGFRIERPDGTLLEEFGAAIGVATNNVAEYQGLIAALNWARAHDEPAVHIRSDSLLLVQQMLGNYKVKNPGLQPLHTRARLLSLEIGRVTFEHIPRAQNAHADRLANAAMDEAAGAAPAGQPAVGQPSRVALRPGGQVETEASRSKSASAVRQSSLPIGDAQPEAGNGPGPAERAVRLFVYRHFLDTALAPDVDAIAGGTRLHPDRVVAALRRLAELHAIVLAPASTAIWMAHPFSAVPTAYPVDVNGRTYWANCAWDAAGVLSMLGVDGESRTRCADCGEAVAIVVRNGQLESDGVVHFAVPPRRFWENIGYT